MNAVTRLVESRKNAFQLVFVARQNGDHFILLHVDSLMLHFRRRRWSGRRSMEMCPWRGDRDRAVALSLPTSTGCRAVLRHEPRTAHDDRPIPSTFVRRTTMKITRGLSTRSQGHGAGAHSRVPAPVASDAIATFSGSDSSSCRVENAKNEPGNFSASSRIVATSFASKASRPKLFDSPKTRTGKSSRSKSVSLWYQHAKSISRFVCASNLMSIPVE
jgi:hypothetical protein